MHNFSLLLLSLSILLQAGKQSKMNLDKVHFIVLYVAARIIIICYYYYHQYYCYVVAPIILR